MENRIDASPANGTAFVIVVSALSYVALHTLVPGTAWMALGLWDPEVSWDMVRGNAAHPLWFLLQLPRFTAGVLAGIIAAKLKPSGHAVVATVLFIVGLLVNGFEQFPSNASPVVLFGWSMSPSAGIVLGFMLWRRRLRSSSERT